jgi:hypothetical protein
VKLDLSDEAKAVIESSRTEATETEGDSPALAVPDAARSTP